MSIDESRTQTMRALEELKEFEDRKPRLEGAGMRREIRFPKSAEEPRRPRAIPTSTAVESSRIAKTRQEACRGQ
jgi:hypothetical protein